jgi:hypothetical protein
MSPSPNPPDLVALYVDQGLSLAVVGRRFGVTPLTGSAPAWWPLGYRYDRLHGYPPSLTNRCRSLLDQVSG